MKRIRILAAFMAVLMIVGTVPALAADTEPAAEDTVSALETMDSAVEEAVDWKLLLVNPWNPLPDGYTVELKRLFNGLKVDARIYDDLAAMLTACREDGLQPIVCSAYRPMATQQRLYRNKIARLRAAGYSQEAAIQEAGRWVAVPGTSEHQTGMALDIVAASYQLLDQKQEETAEQKWLMEHCWEYGFILRYPKDKCDITGIGYEPWHYRYVGREAAAEMRDKDLCLEEYLRGAAETPTEQPIEEQMVEKAAEPTAETT